MVDAPSAEFPSLAETAPSTRTIAIARSCTTTVVDDEARPPIHYGDQSQLHLPSAYCACSGLVALAVGFLIRISSAGLFAF